MRIRIPTKETIKRNTMSEMKELGIHKPYYNRMIDLYAETLHDYYRLRNEYAESGYREEVETGTGSTKRSGTSVAIDEKLGCILQFSDKLGLTPQAFEKITTENQTKSSLADVLSKFDSDD